MSKNNTIYALCMACGRLKNTELFGEGEPVCDDCHTRDDHSARYKERKDGYFEER